MTPTIRDIVLKSVVFIYTVSISPIAWVPLPHGFSTQLSLYLLSSQSIRRAVAVPSMHFDSNFP